ncbi:hypothetical protein GQ457_02G015700 [Hibiscus cannabinus]
MQRNFRQQVDEHFVERRDLLSYCNRLALEFSESSIGSSCTNHVTREVLQWIRPPLSWLKANVDGTVYSSDNRASIDGVMRDSNGDCQFEFMLNLGCCSIMLAELWAIHDMFLHSWRLGFRRIEIETNNFEAVRILKGFSTALSGHSIVTSIKELLAFDWKVSVQHIYSQKFSDWCYSPC